MQLWQKAMIYLATRGKVKNFMEAYLSGSVLARRFCGGSDPDAAVKTARHLKSAGRTASLFYLGEYITDTTVIGKTLNSLERAAALAGQAGLDCHISVDPTQIGLMQGFPPCRANLFRLARRIRSGPGTRDVLMIDMEDSSVTDATLDLFHQLATEGLPVAVTLQACLYRTPEDLDKIMERPAMVRLVKGAFAEGSAIAWTRKADIDRAYRSLASQMLSNDSVSKGFYPVFATHDHRMAARISEMARDNGIPKQAFEFEMLYGVRPGLEESLIKDDFQVRLYLPFGRDFWSYSIRRIGENPGNIKFLLRSLIN